MAITKVAYPMVLFASGLAGGVLWSPLERQHTVDSRPLADVQSENREFMVQIKKLYGNDTAGFVSQFADLTTRIKGGPFDGWASPDGRFIIRLVGRDETIASELQYNYEDDLSEMVRHYSFSWKGKTWSCNFGRNIDDSAMPDIHFSFANAEGGELTYKDTDADGRWDRLIDYTQDSPTLYVRDGACWKEQRAKDDSEGLNLVPKNKNR